MSNQTLAELTCYKGFHVVGRIMTKTGIYAPFFPDIASFLLDPRRLQVLVEAMTPIVKQWRPDLIAAPATRGLILATPLALKLHKPFIFTRSKTKKYHLKKRIEGTWQPGQRVVIVDDGLARSATKQDMVHLLMKAGLRVAGCAIFLDAWKGTRSKKLLQQRKWLRQQPFPIKVFLGWRETFRAARERKFFSNQFLSCVEMYFRNPHAWAQNPKNWRQFKTLAQREQNLIFHPSFRKI